MQSMQVPSELYLLHYRGTGTHFPYLDIKYRSMHDKQLLPLVGSGSLQFGSTNAEQLPEINL